MPPPAGPDSLQSLPAAPARWKSIFSASALTGKQRERGRALAKIGRAQGGLWRLPLWESPEPRWPAPPLQAGPPPADGVCWAPLPAGAQSNCWVDVTLQMPGVCCKKLLIRLPDPRPSPPLCAGGVEGSLGVSGEDEVVWQQLQPWDNGLFSGSHTTCCFWFLLIFSSQSCALSALTRQFYVVGLEELLGST